MKWEEADDLGAVLDAIDSLVRSRGYLEERRPSFSQEEIARSQKALDLRLPLDLRLFATWFDDSLWSHFVNPHQLRVSDADHPTVTTSGDLITPGSEHDQIHDQIRIHDLSEWEVTTPISPESELHGGFYRAYILEEKMFSEAWATARFIEFGSSAYFETLYYCVEPPDRAGGCVAARIYDTPSLCILADSLSKWLAKLVATGGDEIAFAPGSIGDVPRRLRKRLVRDFNRLNPYCDWFR